MSSLFSDLPWFLQEYIHDSRWRSFRDIQLETYDLILNSRSHILISAGTSSGKTEAAMFPIIGSLYEDEPKGFGALYIGPLKALIDDQFERLKPILRDSDINVTEWHGDVSNHKKTQSLDNPSGILQITPESLQNIVTNKPERLCQLFSQLRFVVIDEVHAFMASDRGLQLLCCLERIEKITGCKPRRLGLSATISDPKPVCEWISANTGVDTKVVTDDACGNREVEIRYNRFPEATEEDPLSRGVSITEYYQELYSDIKGKSCIVFANSRDSAEKTAHSLMIMANRDNRPGEVFIHHGSISKELRTNAEKALKSSEMKAAVVATVTLELGIDIGNLDRIVQIGTPFTCSSMVQRMGRSGRRGGMQNMVVYCNEDYGKPFAGPGEMFWDLIKCIALVELIINDRWIEPCESPKMPFGLLFHQTIQYIKSGIGCRFKELKEEVLSLYPFRNIDDDDYRILLKDMLKNGFLQKMEDGTLLLGPRGESLAFNREFCAVFSVGKEVEIVFNEKSIGSIQHIPREGDLIQLAGRIWRIKQYSAKESRAEVEESDGNVTTPWSSSIPNVNTRILKKMKDVLFSSDEYPYLDENAANALEHFRKMAMTEGMDRTFVPTSTGYRIYPWLGDKQFDTLRMILMQLPGIGGVRSRQPYYMDITTDLGEGKIRQMITDMQNDPESFRPYVNREELEIGKYDTYILGDLLAEQFVADQIDLDFELEKD